MNDVKLCVELAQSNISESSQWFTLRMRLRGGHGSRWNGALLTFTEELTRTLARNLDRRNRFVIAHFLSAGTDSLAGASTSGFGLLYCLADGLPERLCVIGQLLFQQCLQLGGSISFDHLRFGHYDGATSVERKMMGFVIREASDHARPDKKGPLPDEAFEEGGIKFFLTMEHRGCIEDEVGSLIEFYQHLMLFGVGLSSDFDPIERWHQRRACTNLASASPSQAIGALKLKEERNSGCLEFHVIPATRTPFLY
ncbi:hypothetical protein A1351_09975 [Methylosinus sp. R-45379]|nr:hypothetical protein A1351_09975 [Methylosinus sp. R-45379]